MLCSRPDNLLTSWQRKRVPRCYAHDSDQWSFDASHTIVAESSDAAHAQPSAQQRLRGTSDSMLLISHNP
eukprot:2938544-Amphidinium_carterae.1